MERILVLCDDVWHPAEVIEKGLASLAGEYYQFDVIKAVKDILTPEMLSNYRLVLCCKSNNVIAANSEPWFEEGVTEAGPREFRAFVEAGGTFVAVHSAVAFSEDFCREEERFRKPCREYIDFVGSTFHGHPLRCPVHIHVSDPAHPAMQGVGDFTERDEHYQIDVIAGDAQIFLETSSEPGGTKPAGYVRKMGKGRLWVLTPGHTLAVWKNENFKQILRNILHESFSEQVQ